MMQLIASDGKACCRFVYQIVVPKQLADKDLLKIFQSDKKVVLPAWDPMVHYSRC